MAATATVAAIGALLAAPSSGPAQATVAPGNTAPPTIGGSAVKDATLTASSGSWSGTTPIDFAYRWLRCDENGASCADISGAAAQTYIVGSTDVGKRLRVRVTATNADGTATALSESTGVVTEGSAPVNTGEPTVTGLAVQGQTLSASSGSWTGAAPISFAYQWVRCGTDGGTPDGSSCATIGGATTSTYTLASGDVGTRLRVRVSATNTFGSKTAASNPTAAIASSVTAGKPVNTGEPRISGTPTAGQALSTSSGSWTGQQPISFSYQWVRCAANGGAADGSNCPAIGGATQPTYTATPADVGTRLRVRVTARNSVGTTIVASNATSAVAVAGPVGVITLANGERSIPASSVPRDQRLVVDAVVFSPNPVRSRTTPIVVRVKVKDTRGYVVRDARVFIRSTPLVTSGADNATTSSDGWIQYTLTPRSIFPRIQSGYSVQFFVKAYRAGDPVLGGVSGTRLVQVRLAR